LHRRVVDPQGTAWDVSREWFRGPDWSRSSPDPGDDTIEDAGEMLEWGGMFEDSGWWTVLVLVGSLLVVLLFFVRFPVVFAVLGLAVALGVLVARLLSISPWTVAARSSGTRLEWRVRGTLRSARAVRDIAAALERGGEWPLVDGRRPDVVEASPV
jgi:hypothetical protein